MTKMKRLMIAACVSVMLFGNIAGAAAASYTGTVNEDKVFFRTNPYAYGAYHYQLDRGDVVTVTGVSGDFYAIEENGNIGYVMKKFVTLHENAQRALNGGFADIPGMEGIYEIGDIPVPATSRKGDQGEDVKALQQALTLEGFYQGKIDGKFGESTEEAVLKYQEEMKLARDGIAGPATIRALFGKNPSQGVKVTVKPVATQKPASSASGNQSNMSGIKSISDIPVPATSRKGDSGDDVRALQQALKLKGFYNGVIDGDFGENTENAVIRFQQSMSLSRDGVAGPATIRALFGKNPASSNTATAKPTATQKPSVSQSASGGMNGIDSISDIPVPATSRKGDDGADVRALQQALKLKGFYSGAIDGDYGNNTEEAVKRFQKSVGLSQDGVAGPVTIRILFGKNPASVTTATPKVTATPKATATPKPKAGMNGIEKISDIAVPAVCEKGDEGADVKALQQALTLKGFYNGAIDGDYGENTVKAVKAFQKSKGLAQDGKAGAVTIRTLFGKNPKATATPKPTQKPTPKPTAKPTATPKVYKTERLDWFNGGANKIPRGATFQVKDVATGKIFTVKRWAGANHIDAEPKTASDTATMKSIYGGSWSWNRRAVLVKYNGHVYAGSMNGMPHGTSTISGNNFNGHFCIHFYKSKTHGTKRVDANHQNAVSRAMNATW